MRFRWIDSKGSCAAGNFFYPPHCLFCHCDLPESSIKLCASCQERLRPKETALCLRCCAPVGPNLNTDNGCFLCLGDRFTFSRVLALGVYEGELSRICLQAKHSRQPGLATGLGTMLWERRGPFLSEWRPDLVLAVPRHWTSRLWANEAPASVIAATLATLLPCPLGRHILRKTRRTAAQSSLTPAERRKNLRNVFRVARGVRLEGCRVLLVDDVLTTGTTAEQIARVLRLAGAGEIIVAVAARGIGTPTGVA